VGGGNVFVSCGNLLFLFATLNHALNAPSRRNSLKIVCLNTVSTLLYDEQLWCSANLGRPLICTWPWAAATDGPGNACIAVSASVGKLRCKSPPEADTAKQAISGPPVAGGHSPVHINGRSKAARHQNCRHFQGLEKVTEKLRKSPVLRLLQIAG
jgi:hypothetical protein